MRYDVSRLMMMFLRFILEKLLKDNFHTRKKKEQDCEYIRWLSFTVNSVNLGDVKIDGHNVSARKVPIQES